MEQELLSKKVIRFIESNLYIPRGIHSGKPFKLLEYQKEIIELIYDNPNGTRKAIISMPRGGAKSSFCSALAICHMGGPCVVENTTLVSTARKLDQAKIVLKDIADMITASPTISKHFKIRLSRNEIVCDEFNTTFKSLSADKGGVLGRFDIFHIADEVGLIETPSDELISNIEGGMGKNANPLSIYISTQAAKNDHFLSQEIDEALKGTNPRVVCKVYQCPENVDPFSPEALSYHPGLGVTVTKEELEMKQSEAKRLPHKLAEFRNKDLNQRVDFNEPFITKAIWDEGNLPLESSTGSNGKKKDLFLGLDLAASNDLAGLVGFYRGDSGKVNVKSFAYLPADNLADKAHADKTDWVRFSNEGFLTATPGPTIDYAYVARDIIALSEEFNIIALGYDAKFVKYLKLDLINQGMSEKFFDSICKPIIQGPYSLEPGVRLIERLFLQNEVIHGGHKVLAECFRNVKLAYDNNDNRKFVKRSNAKSSGKIDLAVAAAMAGVVMSDYDVNNPKLKQYSGWFVST